MRWGGPAEDKARSCSQRCHLIEKQLLLRSIFCSLGSQNKTKNVYLMNTCSFQFVPTKGKSKKKKKEMQFKVFPTHGGLVKSSVHFCYQCLPSVGYF